MTCRRGALATCVAVLTSSLLLFASPNHPDPFPTELTEPRVDVLEDGQVVINFETKGQYKGLVTFNLKNDGSGWSGTWVLAVRYTDNTDPATGIEPANHDHETAEQHEVASATGDADHPHRDYVTYVDRGTIAGMIDAAAIDLDADGKLTDFRAQLQITTGTLTFDGATGTGLAEFARGLALAF